MMFYWITCSFMIGVIYYNYYLHKIKKKLKNIKFRFNYPIIGAAYHFIKLKPFPEKMNDFIRLCKESSETFAIWFGPKLTMVVRSPEDIKTVLTSTDCYKKDSSYDIFTSYSLKDIGILYTKPEIWKVRRRMFNPCFNTLRVISDMPLIKELCTNMINKVEKHCDGKVFNFFHISHTISLDANFIINFSINLTPEQNHRLTKIVENMLKGLGVSLAQYFTVYPLYYLKRKFNFDNGVKKHVLMASKLIGECYQSNYKEFVKNYEKELKEKNEENEQEEQNILEKIRKSPDNLMHKFYKLKYHKIIDDDEISDHINVVLLAGTDTVATTLANCVICLAIHQDVQEKLVQEIDNVFKECGITDVDDIDFDMIKRFTYLDRVVKESLRTLPSVELIGRESAKDIVLENGTVPAGTTIIIPISAFHLTESIWGPNADVFNPDNFLPEKVEQMHRSSFIAFSYGNRNCIGQIHGDTLLRMFIIKLFKRYKFTTPLKWEDLKYDYKITAELKTGFLVQVSRR